MKKTINLTYIWVNDKNSSMSEQILKLIYDFTKDYIDPSSKLSLDENNKNLSILIKNGNINITLTIDPNQKSNYDELVNIFKTNIAKIKDVLSVNVILTSEKTSNHSNQENKRFKINTKNIIAIASGKGGVGK